MRRRERRAAGEISPNLDDRSFTINCGRGEGLRQVCEIGVAQGLENDLQLAQTLLLELVVDTMNPSGKTELVEEVVKLTNKTRYVLTADQKDSLTDLIPYLEGEVEYIKYYGGFSRESITKSHTVNRTIESLKTLLGTGQN